MQYLARYRSLLGAAISALVLCVGLGLAVAPARADDRDHHDRGRDHFRDRRDHCCYAPAVPIYAPPPVYVPPAPVAPGINLIIPFHFR